MDDLQTLSYFVNHSPQIATESQFRWWIFNRDRNGIESAGAVVKKAGRWYINVTRLHEWILAGDVEAA